MSNHLDHSTSARFYSWVYPFIIVITTAVVFGQLVTADFLGWDEQFNIWQNQDLNPPTLAGIAHYWAHAAYGLYIPLAYSVWGLLAAVAHVSTPDAHGATLNPAIFHFSNILFHVLSALLVYGILLRLLGRDHRAACFGAMLFAIHPVQVEPVAWVAGLKDVLAGMLALAAIWQYIAFAQTSRHKALHYSIAIVAFVLAMLSKPSAMVTPAIILAIDWLMLRRPIKQIVISLVPWVIPAVMCAVIARMAQPAIGIQGWSIWERPLLAADSLAFYLYKLVWPINLAPDYGWQPVEIAKQWWFYVIWIVPIMIGVLLALSRKRQKGLFAGGLIFVLGVLPVLGLVKFLFQHFSTTADHYLYLSMFGVALAFGWFLSHVRYAIVALVAGLWLSALGIRSFLQTRYWSDDYALWTHTIDVNPKSFMAMSNLSVVLIAQKDFADAEPYLQRAIEVDPDYIQAYDNLAYVYEQLGQWDNAIAARQKGLRVQVDPHRPPEIRGDLVPPLYKLAFDHIQAHHFDSARACLAQALKYDPQRKETLNMVNFLNEEEKRAATSQPASKPAP